MSKYIFIPVGPGLLIPVLKDRTNQKPVTGTEEKNLNNKNQFNQKSRKK